MDKAHGRLEERHYRNTAVATAYIREELGFPGVRQVVRVQRHRTELSTKKESRERVHVITSRDPARAELAQLAGYIRGHWGIEKRLHNVRDGRSAFDEDHQTVQGPAAQVMAILRNVAISCVRLAGRHSIASSLR